MVTSKNVSRGYRALAVAALALQVLACGGSSGVGDGGSDGGGTVGTPGLDGVSTDGSGGAIVAGGGGIAAGGGGIPGNGGMTGKGGATSASGGAPGTGGSATCGAPGYACCTGNGCNGGGCCVAGICMAPGGACVGLGGGTCANGSCGTCGGPGQPCCADGAAGTCTAVDTKCSNGVCSKCGDLGSACCAATSGSAAGICNAANSICSNNLCVACGAPGTSCCPGNGCTGTACCYNAVCVAEGTACGTVAGACQAGRCSGCGAASQACCNNTCYDGLLCKSNLCSACGGSGQPCCTATTAAEQCTGNLACTSTGTDGVCARCGTLGDICCAGGTCSSGCCSGGRCLSSCSTSDAGTTPDGPVSACATGGMPCSAIAHFTGTQVVDGKDDEFCNIPSFELNFTNAAVVNVYNTSSSSTKTYSERAVSRVAWDAKGIHAFIRVYDTTFTPATSIELWNGDGVELMFSSSTAVTGLTSYDTNTFHVIASPPLAQSSKDSASTGTQTALPTSAYATGSDTTGYWIELNLPWPGTAVPAAGSQIKFELQLNSADGPAGLYDSYVRDAQAIFTQGTVTSTTCASSTLIYPFCDDRVWCTTTLQP